MDAKLEAALERWREAGLISEALAEALRAHEVAHVLAGRPGDARYRGRLLNFLTYVAVAALMAGIWLLAPPEHGGGGPASAQILGAAFAATFALLTEWAEQERAADALAMGALVMFTTGVALLFEHYGGDGEAALGWILTSLMTIGLGVWLARRVRSPAAAIGAAAVTVATPVALALYLADVRRPGGTEFEHTVEALSTGEVLLVLGAMLAIAAALAAAINRGWIRLPEESRFWAHAAIGATLSAALIVAAIGRESVGYDVLLLLGAVLFYGLTVWRGNPAWLLASATTWMATSFTLTAEIDDTERLALSAATLAVTLAALHSPWRQALRHWLSGGWELLVTLSGMILALIVVFADGGWPALAMVWALALAAAGYESERPISFAGGVAVLGLGTAILAAMNIDSTGGIGVGLVLAGLAVVGASVLWRDRTSEVVRGRRAQWRD